MSQKDPSHKLAAQFSQTEFEAMREDGVSEYTIRFADGRERTTPFTILAYFARLDPEASVEPT